MDKEHRIEKIKSLVNELKELYGAESAHLFVDRDYEYEGVSDEYVIRLKSCKINTDGSTILPSYDNQRITIE